MSYILDALRRADAERERGSVPGLHAQLVPTRGADEPATRRALPAWAGFAGGALVVAAAIGAWQWLAHDDKPMETTAATPAPRPVTEAAEARAAMNPPTTAAPTAPPVQQTPALPSARPAPAPAPAPAAAPVQRPAPAPSPAALAAPAAAATQFSTPAMPPAGALPARPVPSTAPTAPPAAAAVNTARAPAPAVAPARAPATVDATTAAAGAITAPSTPLPAQARAPAAPADERLYTVNELPDHLRREWPALSVGGSMFGGDAASRFLIINGQILHEGERLAPELSLEEIRLKAAVLRFKGHRVLIRF